MFCPNSKKQCVKEKCALWRFYRGEGYCGIGWSQIRINEIAKEADHHIENHHLVNKSYQLLIQEKIKAFEIETKREENLIEIIKKAIREIEMEKI